MKLYEVLIIVCVMAVFLTVGVLIYNKPVNAQSRNENRITEHARVNDCVVYQISVGMGYMFFVRCGEGEPVALR